MTKRQKHIPGRKHVPQRSCVVCRRKLDKRCLTRIVRSPDPGGKLNGRGSYLCDDRDCWQKALSSQVLDRALLTEVTEDDRARLAQHMPQP